MWQNLGALQTSLAEAFKTLCTLTVLIIMTSIILAYSFLGFIAPANYVRFSQGTNLLNRKNYLYRSH